MNNPNLQLPISQLRVCFQTSELLRRLPGDQTVGTLCNMSKQELWDFLGSEILTLEVQQALGHLGLKLKGN